MTHTADNTQARVLSASWDLFHMIKAAGGRLSVHDAHERLGPFAERVFATGVAAGWLLFDQEHGGFSIVDGQHPMSHEHLPPHVQQLIDEATGKLGGGHWHAPFVTDETFRERFRRLRRGTLGAIGGSLLGTVMGAYLFGRQRAAPTHTTETFVNGEPIPRALGLGFGHCDCGAMMVSIHNPRTGAQLAYIHVGGGHGDDGGGEELDPDDVEGEGVEGEGEEGDGENGHHPPHDAPFPSRPGPRPSGLPPVVAEA